MQSLGPPLLIKEVDERGGGEEEEVSEEEKCLFEKVCFNRTLIDAQHQRLMAMAGQSLFLASWRKQEVPSLKL